jgi:hypothetical protein
MVGFNSEIGREMWKDFVIACCEAGVDLGCLSSISRIMSLTRALAVRRLSGSVNTFSRSKGVSIVFSKGNLISMAELRGQGEGRTGLPFEHPAKDLDVVI